MPSMLSFRSWLTSGSMLSSPNTWTAPLSNLVTRPLAEQAVSQSTPTADPEGSLTIQVDLGQSRRVECIALLGISGFQSAGATVVSVSWTGLTQTYTVPVDATGGSDALTGLVFIAPTRRNERYITININNGSEIIRIGRLWIGPVFGLGQIENFSEVPSVFGGWDQGYIEKGLVAESPGAQKVGREAARARYWAGQYGDLPYSLVHSLGSNGSYPNAPLDGIAAAFGNTQPMVFCARTEAHGSDSAMRVRSNHLVYGPQVAPWSFTQLTPDAFSVPLRFEGEK